MKKTLALLLTAAMALSLVACGGSSSGGSASTAAGPAEASTTAAEASTAAEEASTAAEEASTAEAEAEPAGEDITLDVIICQYGRTPRTGSLARA